MQLTAPYSQQWPYFGGPPTEFSADASGAGLQPAPDSSAWSNLLSVQKLNPPLWHGAYGVFSHMFLIVPADGIQASGGASLADLEISLDDPIGTNLSINVEDAFLAQSRNCCSSFIAEVKAADGTTGALPSWLSLTYGFVPDAEPIFNTSEIFDQYGEQSFLDVGLSLGLASYPGTQAVGSYLVLITAISADQSPLRTTKSFTLKVSMLSQERLNKRLVHQAGTSLCRHCAMQCL